MHSKTLVKHFKLAFFYIPITLYSKEIILMLKAAKRSMRLGTTTELNSKITRYHQLSKNAGLSPNDKVIKYHVSPEKLTAIFQTKNPLIKITEPFLYELYHSVKNTGFFLELLDENGVILYMIGDNYIVDIVKQSNMKVGARMDIESAGTNAISISMLENSPCQLKGNDHFLTIFNQFTCSCAPIHDETGTIVGFINLNGYNHNAHRHTLGLVVAAVNAVSNQLLYENTLRQIDYANRVTNSVIESIGFGILTINNLGKIIFINSFAEKLIHDFNSAGNYIFDYFLGDDLKRQILSSNELKNDHFILKSSMEEVILESHSIIKNDGRVNGFVMVLKPINSILDFASKYTDLKPKSSLKDFICKDTKMTNIIRYARKIANSPSTVHIHGEPGVGKTMIAEGIHNASTRANMPFATVNCALKNQADLLYDLFGNNEFSLKKQHRYTGKLNASLSGTILIKEIDHMPLNIQNKLLDYIRSKKSEGDGLYSRIISTSNRDLAEEVKKSHFNIELYYELSVIPMSIPPLRSRPSDIKALIQHYLIEKSNQLNRPIMKLDHDVLAVLYRYDYKGNVNELKNIIERIVNLNGKLEFDLNLKENQHTEKDRINFNIDHLSLQEIEEIAIKNCLKNNNYNYMVSAKQLGISRGTLYNKLKKINQ